VCCWKKQEFGKESLHVSFYCLYRQIGNTELDIKIVE
jgi:hypothetical protein